MGWHSEGEQQYIQKHETTLTKGGTVAFPIRGKVAKDGLLGEHFPGQGEAFSWQDGLNNVETRERRAHLSF